MVINKKIRAIGGRFAMKDILVTGGTGFIGSHTCVELIEAGYSIIVVDNLSNSKEESLNRIYQITGQKIKFYKADILDEDAIDKIFDENDINAVIHFAGLKAVGESVRKPVEYYHIQAVVLLLQSRLPEFLCPFAIPAPSPPSPPNLAR